MFVKFLPNQYVLRYRKGNLVKEGPGLSFRYFERTASCCVVPISGTDVDFVFTEQTVDYQSVTVQGTLTYRICDYKKIASLMDFTINLKTKQYNNDPMTILSKRMIDLSDVMVKKHVSAMDLTTAIQSGTGIADKIAEEIRTNEQLEHLGIEVIGFSILKISANNETTRALETGTREEILKQADIALYDRRNASIEHERLVKENELNTEISVEAKKKQIREAEVETRRMLLEKENEIKKIESAAEIERKQVELDAVNALKKSEAAALIERKRIEQDAATALKKSETAAEIERRQVEHDAATALKKSETAAEIERRQIELDAENTLKKSETAAVIERESLELDAQIELERKRCELSDLRLENAKKDADAEAYRLREVMKAYSCISAEVLVALATLDMEPERMIAGAFEKLAANSAKIGTLNITPDLLESLKGIKTV